MLVPQSKAECQLCKPRRDFSALGAEKFRSLDGRVCEFAAFCARSRVAWPLLYDRHRGDFSSRHILRGGGRVSGRTVPQCMRRLGRVTTCANGLLRAQSRRRSGCVLRVRRRSREQSHSLARRCVPGCARAGAVCVADHRSISRTYAARSRRASSLDADHRTARPPLRLSDLAQPQYGCVCWSG